ncbi:MAG: DUF4878 domain-containing protein [bacterium]|nr:DUF4878 domain-containing protein [bacterium]
MKRSWWSIALVAGCLLCLALMSGCGGGAGSTPEKTVKNFYKATKNQDLDAMLKCMAPDLREMSEKVIEKEGKENARKGMAGAGELEKYEIKDAKITGDRAEVKVAVTSEGKTEEKTEYLSRIDGRWYVDVPEDVKKMKEGLEKMDDPKMKEMMKKMQEGLKEGMPEGAPKLPE